MASAMSTSTRNTDPVAQELKKEELNETEDVFTPIQVKVKNEQGDNLYHEY